MSTQTESVGPFSKPGTTSTRTLQLQSGSARAALCEVLHECPRTVQRGRSRLGVAVKAVGLLYPSPALTALMKAPGWPLRPRGWNTLGLIALWFLLCTLSATRAYATSQCLQFATAWQSGAGASFEWHDSPQEAGQAAAAFCMATNQTCNLGGGCVVRCIVTVTGVYPVQGWDGGPSTNAYTVTLLVAGTWLSPNPLPSKTGLLARIAPSCQVFVTRVSPRQPQCGPTCSGVGHPINPASGAVYDMIVDLPSPANSPSFKRYYNSTDVSPTYLNPGWRHTFSRTIQPRYASSDYLPYVQSADNSSLYTDEATACMSGFAEIKAGVSTWANASASYANGVCSLSVGGTQIGTLTLHYTPQPIPSPSALTLVGFDATRDDGQLVSFALQGSALVAPPSIGLKLQQTSSGYTLTDENDTVETYDANGRLLSVTNRAGVVQTMGYDTSNRLSTVTDSFGHSLSLTYDGLNRLSTVTRQ